MANQFARELRRNVTEAEKKLWQQLRLLKDENRHFRRQVPIGAYIADFACHYCKLVVELMAVSTMKRRIFSAIRSELMNCKNAAIALSDFGTRMFLKILKVLLT